MTKRHSPHKLANEPKQNFIPVDRDEINYKREIISPKEKARTGKMGLIGLTNVASEVVPAGPKAADTPGSANVPGTEDFGVVIVAPGWAGDGDGARTEL